LKLQLVAGFSSACWNHPTIRAHFDILDIERNELFAPELAVHDEREDRSFPLPLSHIP